MTTGISARIPDHLHPDSTLPRLRAWLLLPHDRLSRLRQAMLFINLLLSAAFLQAMSSSAMSTASIAIASCALMWLDWRWFLVVRRRTSLVYWDLAEGLAFGIVGSGLTSPLDTAGLLYLMLLYGGLVFHALSLEVRRVIITTLCYLLAYSVVLLHLLGGIPYEQLPRIGLLPLPGLAFLAVLSFITARAFSDQSAMETIRQHLDHASAALAAAQSGERIASTTIEIAANLIPSPGVAVCFLRRGEQETLVTRPGESRAMVLTEPLPLEDLPAPHREHLGAGNAVMLEAGTAEWFRRVVDVPATSHKLYAVPLCSSTGLAGLLVVAVPAPLHDLDVDALETLGRHASLAIERIQRLQALRQREETYRSLVHHALDAMLVIAVDTTVQYETPAFGSLLRDAGTQLGQRFTDLLHAEDVRSVAKALTALVDRPGASDTFECRIRRGAGSWIPIEVSAHNRLADPAVGGVVLTCRDISERKQLESRLFQQAFHDPLTELPNRAHFLAHLGRALAEPDEPGDYTQLVSVLFLDLDRFKIINDSLGHEAGDYLLQAAAKRLRDCLRPTDVVARFGGDEFAILLADLRDEGLATRVAQRVIASLQAPVTIRGQQLYTSTSIGIAFARAGSVEPEELLHRADTAMYIAKREGKGRYCTFNPSMVADSLVRLQLESELHEAIRQGTLEIYYQPLISLDSGQVCELEALVRWPHPERGLLSPGSFIPLAEESGQIIPLDTWVLEQVCRQLQQRLAQSPGPGAIAPISVNLSALQFQQPRFAEEVVRILSTWSIPPKLLKFEITEGTMMRDEQLTIATIDKLRQLGVKIAIDDFGVGYSSLSALRRFSVDALKIDRSFVAGLGRHKGDTAIIQAMITYAKTVGMSIVAEGIETRDQLQHLQALGCDVGQGYFLAKPHASPSNLRPVRILEVPPAAANETRSGDSGIDRVIPLSAVRRA